MEKLRLGSDPPDGNQLGRIFDFSGPGFFLDFEHALL